MATKPCGDGPGAHYTPDKLAGDFVWRALRYWNYTTGKPDHERAMVTDPACGDGFLLRQAIRHGVPPDQCTGIDISQKAIDNASTILRDESERQGWDARPELILGDSLFDDCYPETDITIGNPPWIGKVSGVLGADYARRVAKRFGTREHPYNAASDLCAAFVLRAAEVSGQVSMLLTKTAMEGRTFRSGIQRLLLSGEWSMLHMLDDGARFNGRGVRPSVHRWPGAADVCYIEVHLVRTSLERFEAFKGHPHWAMTKPD